MPLEDYAHHNEEARHIWWEEEGKHVHEDELSEPDNDDFRFSDEGDSHHDTEEDCVADGCFNHVTKTECWECSICGRLALGFLPSPHHKHRWEMEHA